MARLRRRRAALDEAIAAIRARFGSRIIRPASDLVLAPSLDDRPPLSSGSLGLDLLTGGLPRGALTEYAGCDGSGRETLAATALARAQAGGLTLLVDPDGTSDPDALAAAGVVLDALPLAYPASAIQAWTVLDLLCRCGALDLVLIISVSGLLDLPGEVRAGRPARLFPRVAQRLLGRRTALLLVNAPLPGDGWRTVADTALAPVARLRVAFHAQGMCLGSHGDLVGLQTRLQVVKHRGHAHPAALDLVITPGGPDHPLELVQLARRLGCLQETSLGLVGADGPIGRTEGHAAAILRRDPELARALEDEVRLTWLRQAELPLAAGAP